MTLPRACPVCDGAKGFAPVEERRDPIGGTLYRLHRCESCALVFSEPRDPVGADWYEKSAPLRAREIRREPGKDWRFLRALDAGLEPGKVLDVGCGDGGFLSVAAARGWTPVGVDYEARMIALARAKGLDAHARDFGEFLKGRAAKEFELVTLFDVLEHVPEPRGLLALIKPVLKRGGHLAVTFPNADRPQPFGAEEYDYPPHHFTRWTARTLRTLLEREGFTIVELRDVGPTAAWFSETLFYGLIAPVAIAVYRRLRFGASAKDKTLTELYAAGGSGGVMADKARRQDLADAFKKACRLFTWPLGLILAGLFRLRSGRGEYLYCLACYETR